MTDEPSRGNATTTLPELRRAGVAVCLATVLARAGPDQRPKEAGPRRTDLDFATQSIAHATARGQLAYYRLLEEQGHVRMLRTRSDLDQHWRQWQRRELDDPPIGIILSMEGADPIVNPEQAEAWWELGLRVVGPAHYGRSHYACGTGVDGPLTRRGVHLLREFERLGMILDVTHLSDTSMAQAMDLFGGPVLASHHNCRELVPGDRQLSDEQIERLIGRDAVIGAAADAWMLYPKWKRGVTRPDVISMGAVADHIDHVCQLAGNSRHSAIGSDLDGGFGTEQTPGDLNTIADLQKLDDILRARGYPSDDIDAIFHGNWMRFLRRTLPV